MSRRLLKLLLAVVPLAVIASTTLPAQADGHLQPDQIQMSELTVEVSHLGTMPFELGPTFVPAVLGPNLASPVTIRDRLYLIDQNDGIYRSNRSGRADPVKIFDVDEDSPAGLTLEGREAVLNISGGSGNKVYVVLSSSTEPAGIPIHRLPAPLPGECCLAEDPIFLEDLYRIGELPGPVAFFGTTETWYQTLIEYKEVENRLVNPRMILAIETQSGPTHTGGGMLTIGNDLILYTTGDGLPFGADGRAAVQDPSEKAVGKLLLINPRTATATVLAQGLRNVQHLELVFPDRPLNKQIIGLTDIGGVTAEEVNYIKLGDLLKTRVIENFGWGRAADGLAREGTFYISPGLPLGFGEPATNGIAPSPEAGFLQPHAQYGRNDPFGGVAINGPVTSTRFDEITGVFTDLASGFLYATTANINAVDAPVHLVNLVLDDGTPIANFDALAGGRADARLFNLPDGSAGVLIEATGDYYRLTEK